LTKISFSAHGQTQLYSKHDEFAKYTDLKIEEKREKLFIIGIFSEDFVNVQFVSKFHAASREKFKTQE